MSKLAAAIVLSIALTGGCVVRESRATVTATASTPDLVEISPGVWVIADYGEPIFYSGGYYWWNIDGYWYRSSIYTGGWVYWPSPPPIIVRIYDPYRYRHYRPHGYVVRHRPVPHHRIERPKVRDHRSRPKPAPRPRVRDHRR